MPQGKIERIEPIGDIITVTTDDRNQVIPVETNGRTLRAGVPAEFQQEPQ